MAKKNSWRQESQSGSKAALWLLIRRSVSSILVMSLIGVFIYALIIVPMLKSGTYFAYITSAQRAPTNGEPIQYALEDFHSFSGLAPGLTSRERGKPPLEFTALEDPRQAAAQLERIAGRRLKRNDCVIVCMTAHGDVAEGVPYLKCSNYSADQPDLGRVSVESVLQRMAELRCATKLLVLDTSRQAWSPERGDRSAHFSRLLKQQVEAMRAPGLWVMTASRGLEQSHVSPALRQSVFGYVLSKGLHGSADWNEDGDLHLNELFHFVKENVAGWVDMQTDGHATQTPQLYHFDLDELQSDPPRLIDLDRLPAVEEPNVLADVQAAESTESSSMLSSVGNYMVGISGQFGIPSPIQIKNRLEPLGNFAGDLLGGNDDKEDGDEEKKPPEPAKAVNPELLPNRVAARRLASAWQFVDQLSPGLESSNAAMPDAPGQQAPQIWRAMVGELLWYDRLHYAGGIVDQDHVASQVARIENGLRYLAGEESAAEPDESSLARRISQLKSETPLTQPDAKSFGLAEMIQEQTLEKMPVELSSIIKRFDSLLKRPDATQWDVWLKEAVAMEGSFAEVQLAQELRDLNVDWTMSKLALSTLRLAEQISSNPMVANGWAQRQIESGDRARWEAERVLKTKVVAEWRQLVSSDFLEAQEYYEKAQAILDKVQAALALRDRAIGRCREYVALLAKQDSVSTSAQLEDFVELCARIHEMDDVLNRGVQDTDATDVPILDHLNRELSGLQFAYNRIENGVDSRALQTLGQSVTGNSWRIESLVDTSLIDAPSRGELSKQWIDVSKNLVGRFEFKQTRPTVYVADDAMSDAEWGTIERRIRLEWKAAELAASVSDAAIKRFQASDSIESLGNLDNSVVSELAEAGVRSVFDLARVPTDAIAKAMSGEQSSQREKANALRDRARWHEFDSFSDRLTAFYRDLSLKVSEISDAGGKDDDRRSLLQAASHDLHLLLAHESASSASNPNIRKSRSDWHRYLLWRAKRARQSAADADPAQQRLAYDNYSHFNGLVEELPGFSPTRPTPPPGLQLTVASSLSLETRKQDVVTVRIESNSVDEAPVWLVLQYDQSALRVLPQQGTRVYVEDDVRDELSKSSENLSSPWRHAAHLAQYPYRADVHAPNEPTVRIQPGGVATISLTVQQLGGARGEAKLVAKAVSRGDYVRGTTRVKLPGDQMFELVLEDPDTQQPLDKDAWRSTSGGALVLPYPNRDHGVVFRIKDKSQATSKVQVELLNPSRRPNSDNLPSSAVSSLVASDLMRPYGATVVGKSPELTVPANGAIAVPFESINLGTNVDATASDPLRASDAAAGMLHIENGLLLVIHDLGRQQKTIKQIHFGVKRPRDYAVATAEYLPSEERLLVKVMLKTDDAIPPGGVLAKLELPEDLKFTGEMSPLLDLRLEKAGEWAELFAPVPAADRRVLTARLSIDDYPRAFVFRVTCTKSSKGVKQPEENLKSVRIVSPKSGEEISATKLKEAKHIRVRVAVDAPKDTFSSLNSKDFVSVGIDRNRDGDLSDERQVQTRRFDRQVKLYVTALDPTGVLRFRANVSDFELDLPAIGLFNAKPFLLGVLNTGNRPVRSQRSVEYIVDGSGPEIKEVDVGNKKRFGESIVSGEETPISLTVTDALTRVAKVELGFDTLGKGSSAGVEKRLEVPLVDIPNNRWQLIEKIPDLPLGAQKLWVFAVDAVGNETKRSFDVEVVPKRVTTQKSNKKLSSDKNNKSKEKVVASPPPTTSIIGRIKGGGRKIQQGTVKLMQGDKLIKEVDTDERGKFRISDVPAGSYVLQSRALTGGNYRKNQTKVRVKPEKGPVLLENIPLQ